MTQLVDWASATRPLAGVQESGDACLVRARRGSALIAVVDGLGHGPDAAAAARRAIKLLEEGEGKDPAATLQRCHESMRSTRGVVASLARFDGERDTMTWAGVGNVGGVVLRSMMGLSRVQEVMRTGSGVVGRQLPAIQSETLPIAPGDTLVFATDGIRPQFARDLEHPLVLQEAADRILGAFGRDDDDALVVVARYRGMAS